MAAVVSEGGPSAEIKASCKKVQVVKGYALDPSEPHIIITYREDWRDPTQIGNHIITPSYHTIRVPCVACRYSFVMVPGGVCCN